ncbi:MAG: hypothetical protein QG614_587 [Patescibacteria group bacterium]|nr:hypothetical protein [Patescibacteria group bacterium]
MKTNELKFTLMKILPKPIFKLVYFIWSHIAIHIFSFFWKNKLNNFKAPTVKEVNASGVKFQILIDPENGTVDNEIFLAGVYEPHFLSVIKEHLKEGGTYVDIGSNIGQHALFSSVVVGNTGKVIAFEPVKRIYEQFLKSVDINNFKNIILYNNGCGERVENLPIYSSNENAGASSVLSSDNKQKIGDIDIIVPDDILIKEDKISLIKIDVEGFELEVLQGLKNTISKFKPIIFIEYSPYYYRMKDANKGKEIIQFLKSFNYNIFDIENQKYISVDDFEYYESNNIMQTNFLCTI